jgi:hypothetical protein
LPPLLAGCSLAAGCQALWAARAREHFTSTRGRGVADPQNGAPLLCSESGRTRSGRRQDRGRSPRRRLAGCAVLLPVADAAAGCNPTPDAADCRFGSTAEAR